MVKYLKVRIQYKYEKKIKFQFVKNLSSFRS